MNIELYSKMVRDKDFLNLKKMKYKYPNDFDDFLNALKSLAYRTLPLKDANGNKLVFCENFYAANTSAYRALLSEKNRDYSETVLESEILSTAKIESIDFTRESVRNIMKGFAPKNEEEDRIYGLKCGFDFISKVENRITEENIYKLYMLTVGNFLDEENKLLPGRYYRHDSVYVVGNGIEHIGMNSRNLPEAISALVNFINTGDDVNELVKAAIIHFYVAYVHPWFDGNGRMARMLHLWYLVQCGYPSTLFVPFSALISKSVKEYYAAFTKAESNQKLSGVTDVTPFVTYITAKVYNNFSAEENLAVNQKKYAEMLNAGQITKKEEALWGFVVNFYIDGEFSTKQLEKDFGNAAYATIRNFVLKLENAGIFTATKYSNRVRYKISK